MFLPSQIFISLLSTHYEDIFFEVCLSAFWVTGSLSQRGGNHVSHVEMTTTSIQEKLIRKGCCSFYVLSCSRTVDGNSLI